MKLAWALADTIADDLRSDERTLVYVQLGAGETFMAIRQVLEIVAREARPLSTDLIGAVASWLDRYIGNEHEPVLRRSLIKIAANTGELRPAHSDKFGYRDGARRGRSASGGLDFVRYRGWVGAAAFVHVDGDSHGDAAIAASAL